MSTRGKTIQHLKLVLLHKTLHHHVLLIPLRFHSIQVLFCSSHIFCLLGVLPSESTPSRQNFSNWLVRGAFFSYQEIYFLLYFFHTFQEDKFHCSCTILGTYNHFIQKKKILKMGPTVLFTHLKIILLQCFQFSVFSKINCIQTECEML